jgi:AbiTii
VSLHVRLLDEIDNVDRPVSAVLLKARRLAEDMPGRKFKSWVQLEMNGYRGTTAVIHNYRSIGVTCTGNFIGARQMTDFPRPLDRFSRATQDLLNRHDFLGSVGMLEGILQTGRENVVSPLPPELIRYFQQTRIPGTQALGHWIVSANTWVNSLDHAKVDRCHYKKHNSVARISTAPGRF